MIVMSHFMFGRFSTPELRQMLAKSLRKVPASTLRARLRAVMSVDVSAEFAALDAPMLYLQALSDRIVPADAAILARQFRPDLRLATLDAPHGLLQAAPFEAARIVGELVRELES